MHADKSYGPGLFAVHAERQAEGRGEAGRTTAPIDGRPDHLDDDDGSQHWPLGAERGRRGPQPTSQRVAITWRRPAPQPALRRTAPHCASGPNRETAVTAHPRHGPQPRRPRLLLRVSGGSAEAVGSHRHSLLLHRAGPSAATPPGTRVHPACSNPITSQTHIYFFCQDFE